MKILLADDHILEKMGLRNDAELMHYAMQRQLVEMVPEGLGVQ